MQLKEERNVKIDIDKFASLGGATLASLLDRSSKVFLRHPEKCEFFSLFGDSIIGHYEISFERILRLYATAVNKDNIINLIDSFGLDTNYSKYKFSVLKKYIFNDKKVADGKLNLILINEKFKAFKTSQFDQNNIKKAFI